MNNFDRLNDLIEYIELHLCDNIDTKKLAQILCVNEYTMYRIFNFISGLSITEYIRNRRLSMAGLELINSKIKVIDLAMKYGYDSPASFSRAFNKFHGVNPSEIGQNVSFLRNFPPISFDNKLENNIRLDFRIEDKPELTFYSIYRNFNLPDIKIMAPKFWKEIDNNSKYLNVFNDNTFGIIEYDNLFPNPKTVNYHIATTKLFENSTKISIPESKWAIFNAENIDGEYMSNLSFYVYKKWIPYSGYNIRNIPEIEAYYKDHTEWWLPIE